MASPSFNEDYLIIRVNQHDQPASTIPHYENAATYISVSISICRGMLRTTKAKEAFKEFAETFHSDLPETTAEEYTQMFINKILDRFPPIFVDYSMLNPDLIACHFRRKWVGYLEAFDTRKQGIAINGPVSRKQPDLTSSMIGKLNML